MLHIRNLPKLMLTILTFTITQQTIADELKYMSTRMPYQPQTLLCGCHIIKHDNQLDGKSCNMPHAKSALKTIIPKEWIANWLSHQGPRSFQKNLKSAMKDPVLYAFFTDKAYSLLRSSKGLIEGLPTYGYIDGCSTSKDDLGRLVTNGSRLGVMSRAALYLEVKYHAKIPAKQKQRLITYAKKYPPTNWEVQRNKQSFEYKGLWNPLISDESPSLNEDKQYLQKINKIQKRIQHLIELRG